MQSLKDTLKTIDIVLNTTLKDRIPYAMTVLSESQHPPYDAPCEVRPSTYGRGVFATRDITKGDFITLYPAHGVAFDRDESGFGYYVGKTPYASEYRIEHTKTNMGYVGNKDIISPLFMGHIINDMYPNVEKFKDKNNLGATTVSYILHSITFSNCTFKEGKYFMIIQATKDIKKDEELSVQYGYNYWGETYHNEGTTQKEFEKHMDSLNPKKRKYIMDLVVAQCSKLNSL
jgi:hypothetical protein